MIPGTPQTSPFNAGDLDDRGRVRVWDKIRKAWKKVDPVDAREQLHQGVVSLTDDPDEEDPSAPPPLNEDEEKMLRDYRASKARAAHAPQGQPLQPALGTAPTRIEPIGDSETERVIEESHVRALQQNRLNEDGTRIDPHDSIPQTGRHGATDLDKQKEAAEREREQAEELARGPEAGRDRRTVSERVQHAARGGVKGPIGDPNNPLDPFKQGDLDASGKVAVWDKGTASWKNVTPVEGREMLRLGKASLNGPDGHPHTRTPAEQGPKTGPAPTPAGSHGKPD